MDHELDHTVKIPIRRTYEVAFSREETGDDDQLEEHIIPEPTVAAVKQDSKEREVENRESTIECQVPSCAMNFATITDYQQHYNSRHMHSCSVCKKSLPSYFILELHVLEIHDTLFSLMAKKKPMYQCFLESCPNKFTTPDLRKEHCIKDHAFSQKFHYWDCKPPKNLGTGKEISKKPQNKNSAKTSNKTQNRPKGESDLINGQELVMEIDTGEIVNHPEIVISCENKSDVKLIDKSAKSDSRTIQSRSVPKHIAFGRAPHRAFRNAYTSAIDSTKDRKKNIGDSSLMDMKDVGEALVTSSEVGVINKTN